MTRSRRLLSLLAFLLGFFGVLACVAVAAALWAISARVIRTNENVFEGIDETVVFVRSQILDTQKRIQASRITIDEIERDLKDWTRSAASDRLSTQLDIDTKAQRLQLALQRADVWLERSSASIQSIRQAFEVGVALGAPVDSASVDPLLDKLTTMRSKLELATETIDGVRERAAESTDKGSREERIDQAVQLAVRLVATITEIDSRLGEYVAGLDEMQAKAEHLKRKTRLYIVTATIVGFFLVAWMAAGQVSLCRHGWKD